MKSCKVTIFEGPDCAGKSTAAEAFARATGAKLFHFGPAPQVKFGLARLYAEAMMIAVNGYQDVVLDRSWFSEAPYGDALRNGADRIGAVNRRMLNRLALRCGAVVVNCFVPHNLQEHTFVIRSESELLPNLAALRQVTKAYSDMRFGLPTISWNYSLGKGPLDPALIDGLRHPCHEVGIESCGNLNAPFIVVGGPLAKPHEHDNLDLPRHVTFNASSLMHHIAVGLLGSELTEVAEADVLWLGNHEALEWADATRPKGLTKVSLATGLFDLEHTANVLVLDSASYRACYSLNVLAQDARCLSLDPRNPPIVTMLRKLKGSPR